MSGRKRKFPTSYVVPPISSDDEVLDDVDVEDGRVVFDDVADLNEAREHRDGQ